MPRKPEHLDQAPLPLFYPAVSELNASNGVMHGTPESLPNVDPEKRITLGRLTGLYGLQYGPNHSVNLSQDPLIEVVREDFWRASPCGLTHGLYIGREDDRYTDPKTEQLIRIHRDRDYHSYGVVFPSDQFHTVARSPLDLIKHAMATTRNANKDNGDTEDVEARVGRTAGHALESKIAAMNKIDAELEAARTAVFVPLQAEAMSNRAHPWIARYRSKDIDALLKSVDKQYHEVIDTAAINFNVGSTALKGAHDTAASALKAAHRAGASALYRTPDNLTRNIRMVDVINMLRRYTQERRIKIAISKEECERILASDYQEFLDQKVAA